MQSYMYSPLVTATQPWFWSPLGGIAILGSPFDAPAPAQPPSGSQYGFVQTSPNGALGLSSSIDVDNARWFEFGVSYSITYYWSARAARALVKPNLAGKLSRKCQSWSADRPFTRASRT